MVEEERLNGVKHTKVYPERSIAWLLDETGLTAADVDAIGYNFSGWRYLQAAPMSVPLLRDRTTRKDVLPRIRGFAAVHHNYRQRMRILRERFPASRVQPILHHRAHGTYAFASSGYARAAVLVIDSLGELQTTTIGSATHRGTGIEYRIRRRVHDPASLGYVYGAVTEHLGWRRGDEEGTVMALAALGDPARFRGVFRRAVRITPDAFFLDPAWFRVRTLQPGWPRVTAKFMAATCPPRLRDTAEVADAGDEVEQVHADLAAALQERTEEVVLHLARRARELTGERHLCLSGGVAMNCVSVGKIVQEGVFDELHVPAAPGDSGTAIGAALNAHQDMNGSALLDIAGRAYYGPEYRMQQAPSAAGVRAHLLTDPAKELAGRLAQGQIVGLFQGALEAGPRALGNRSILASPLNPDVVHRLNATVKFRESFRPFAPVVLATRARDYFELRQPSPFMSIAVPVTEHTRARIPSIAHTNGTARVQTVTNEQNPFLAEVLRHFEVITGVPVLINTSLNIKGKPICGTPDMAITCLRESGLDALLLEGWWVERS